MRQLGAELTKQLTLPDLMARKDQVIETEDDLIVCDSDSFLRTIKNPAGIIVIGGGVIGAEYASMLAAFGIRVTLIDWRTQLLRFLDQEIAQALDSHMQQNGVVMRLGQEQLDISVNEAGNPVVRFQDGETVTPTWCSIRWGGSATRRR